MSNDKKESKASKVTAAALAKAGRVTAAALAILALIAVAILVLKQDDCFPDPEPEPVPCSGEHCPVDGEATTGEVIKDAGSTGVVGTTS